MGVAGCGKSTLGAALAKALGWPFQEGDDLHPPANRAKMASGTPLDDADRGPWLDRVRAWIEARTRAGENGVVSCSVLRRAYRSRLAEGIARPRLVFIDGEAALIARRLASRAGHFMPPGLLASQFETLERPQADEGAIVVPAGGTTAEQMRMVLEALGPAARAEGA